MTRTCCKYFTVSLVPVSALLLAILFACGILALPVIYTELARKHEYGIVIDAGSSHSTAYIYQLDVPLTGKLEELDNHEVHDSINNHALDPSRAGKLVETLIKLTNTSLTSIKVPNTMQHHIEIYLGATAGMRLLRRTNATAANAILSATRTALKNSGYKAKNNHIISGVQEAASGWATANYIHVPKDDFVTSLDMGGASTEIAFPAVWPGGSTSNASRQFYVTEKVMNRSVQLYARSYLCYGHNEALGRFLAHLIDDQGNRTVNMTNPCLAKGTLKNFTFETIYSTCANESIATETFGFSLYPPPGFVKGQNVTFLGTGDTAECQGEIHKVFDFYNCSVDENCDNDTYHPPIVNGSVVGFSGFYYIAKKLNLLDDTFSPSHPVMDAVIKACNKTLATKDNTTHCLNGIFMAYMIERGFGLNKTSAKNWTLQFREKEGGISFGWAMGYFMNRTSAYRETPYHETFPYSTVDMVVGMLILTILCLIFVVFFFLTFYACKKALGTNDGYQSIS